MSHNLKMMMTMTIDDRKWIELQQLQR